MWPALLLRLISSSPAFLPRPQVSSSGTMDWIVQVTGSDTDVVKGAPRRSNTRLEPMELNGKREKFDVASSAGLVRRSLEFTSDV